MPDSTLNIEAIVKNAVENALKARGAANVLIAGKTGVGKSTLINAVFQGQMAETGQGKPVTQSTRKITKEGIPVGIYDTKGLEVKDYKPILDELLKFIETTNKDSDPLRHVHVAWLCIAEGSRRIEDAEIQLGEALAKHMPVVAVITTAVSDQGFKNVVEDNFRFASNVVRINSIEHELDGGLKIPVHGLKELVDITMEVIPEGQKKAFAAAQRIKLGDKVNQAHKVVFAAAASAGGIAAIPVPFSDAVGIVPIQIGMLAGVSAAFGLELNRAFLGSLVSGTFTAVAGTMAGRAAVGSLLKFFPGIGSGAGALISAAVAVSVTTAFGEAYIATLYALLKDSPDKQLSAADVTTAFKNRLADNSGK